MESCIACPENPVQDQGDGIHQPKSLRRNQPMETQERQLLIPPQPYFISGYTGYLPGSGPQRRFTVGETLGHYSHKLLHGHRVAGARMNPLNADLRFVNMYVSPPRQDPKLLMDNPHKAVDPYFIPGYTGFTPNSGIRRADGVGENYALMTHLRLTKHQMGGRRLMPIYEEPPEYIADKEEVKFYVNKHELTASDLLRRHVMVPGYAGYIPRALFHHGETYAKISDTATAEFEKIRKKKY
ncbi:uncharacterized protein CEXT_121051 [Caerostris extrusa]|uniref:Uncharacterized protein n=1 Tax=Caerostris extrusa TaxID=172846 RepID=A0AAV4QC06_CAEEX|nr:uncharacterized protein CEXT_121051 [Caerostris extrusa]